MFNKTAQEFQAMLDELNQNLNIQEIALNTCRRMVTTVVEAEKEAEKEIARIQNKIEAARRGVLLTQSLPKDVIDFRKTIIQRISEVKSQDITVGMKAKLELNIPVITLALQGMCSHPFVFHKAGYQGSPSNDYDDGYPTERYCVVCGFVEKASDFRRNGMSDRLGSVFNTLKDDDNRIIQHEPYRPHPQCLGRVDIWQPLGAVLHPFEKWVENMLNPD